MCLQLPRSPPSDPSFQRPKSRILPSVSLLHSVPELRASRSFQHVSAMRAAASPLCNARSELPPLHLWLNCSWGDVLSRPIHSR